MTTDWKLIREVMNGVIDACEKIDQLAPNLYAGEYEARSDYQGDVRVGDFLERFWQYPEGAARDILIVRSRLGADQKHLTETARALINTATACSEVIGLSKDELESEIPAYQAHCQSGGASVRSLLQAIPQIQNDWMVTGISKALTAVRNKKN